MNNWIRTFILLSCFSWIGSCLSTIMSSTIQKEVTIPNKLWDSNILTTDEDSIYFDEVFLYNRNDTSLCILGNLKDNKSSLFLVLNTKNKDIVFREQSAKIDSVEFQSMDGRIFVSVTSRYIDMCSEQIFFTLYNIEGNHVQKCYHDIMKEVYIGAETYCSDEFVSYNKIYHINCINGTLTINYEKVYDNGLTETKTHRSVVK